MSELYNDIGIGISAIASWTDYIRSVKRDYILNEGTIKVPLSEYINSIKCKDIRLEHRHPIFNRKKIDLTFKLKRSNVAIEFKFIKNNHYNGIDGTQFIFNDIFRLYIAKHSYKTFFIVTGVPSSFYFYFINYEMRSEAYDTNLPPTSKNKTSATKPFFAEWLSFEKDKEVIIRYADFKSYFDKFSKEYNYSGPIPKKIRTKLINSENFLSNNSSGLVRTPVGIWMVY